MILYLNLHIRIWKWNKYRKCISYYCFSKSNVNHIDISITITSSQITFDVDIKIKPTFNLYSEYAVNHDNSEIIYNTAVNEDNWLQYEEGADIQCYDSNVIGYAY